MKKKNVEMLLYNRRPADAVSVLLQARPPLTYRAIKIFVRLFRWNKALEIAIRTGKSEYTDIVIWYRVQYLFNLKLQENNPSFKKLLGHRPVLSRNEFLELKQQIKADE